MPTKKKTSISLAERVKLAKSPALGKLLPGGGATKVVKGLTKAEKVMRTKLKRSIRQRIEEVEEFGIKKTTGLKKGQSSRTSTERKGLRSDIRDLGKIVGEKEAATFTQAKKAAMFKNPKVPRARPRSRR